MKLPKFLFGTLVGTATFILSLGLSLILPPLEITSKLSAYPHGRPDRAPSVSVRSGVHVAPDFDLARRSGRYRLVTDDNAEFASFDHIDIHFTKWRPDALGKWADHPSEPEAHVSGSLIPFDIFFTEGEEVAFQTLSAHGETFVFTGKLRKEKECRNEIELRAGFDGRLVKLTKGKLAATMQASFYLECGC